MPLRRLDEADHNVMHTKKTEKPQDATLKVFVLFYISNLID